MSSNLRDRLRIIKNTQKPGLPAVRRAAEHSEDVPPELISNGWEKAGYKTLKQVFQVRQRLAIPCVFPPALPIVIPDTESCFMRGGGSAAVSISDLLFFDLETTGLSGGAGTVPFLAAFGRLIRSAPEKNAASLADYELQITQYLLLDYPGESDFLDLILGEFTGNPLLVSYNGKAFDTQILRTRCLMRGIQPPMPLHADLLYPARRLWKRLLENCSQGTIEKRILGIDRGDDISGALAPDIWFDFLRNGGTESLLDICKHNRRDIHGLASIFALMVLIADDPIAASGKFTFDIENLALRWHYYMRITAAREAENISCKERAALLSGGKVLLNYAADKGGGQAALALGRFLLGSGFQNEGRQRLLSVAEGDFNAQYKASALRFLAINGERCAGDCESALEYVNKALNLNLNDARRAEFERRKNRLIRKILHARQSPGH